MPELLSIVADVGGTNTRVALAQGQSVDHATIRRFPNAAHQSLGEVLRLFHEGAGLPACTGASVAVAGPVENGVGRLTNLDWVIDNAGLTEATGAAHVLILNDLEAQGYGLAQVGAEALDPVMPAETQPVKDTPQLVIGVGTGFNATVVHRRAGATIVTASESGHVTLPVRSEADLRLMRQVETAYGYADVEDALSGRGLEQLFAFHAGEAGDSRRLKAAEIMAAMPGEDPVVIATGQSFVRFLATVASDLALIHTPFGGVYLIGGVARSFAPHYARFGFARHFRDKGRFSNFLGQFPVSIVTDDYAALAGCARALAEASR